jgi:nicotinic acid mononucleotide adenylyltransferase
MDSNLRSLIESIHRSPRQCVIALTGGGATAIGALLSVPGGSRTILEAVVPYHEQALTEWLGRRPDQFCSADTAAAVARRARERAQWLAPRETVVGVGGTASLATGRPKRGEHRLYVATDAGAQVTTFSLLLQKAARDRAAEEVVLQAVLLNALAESFGVPERTAVPLLPDEVVQVDRQDTADRLAALCRGDSQAIAVHRTGQVGAAVPRPKGLLSGSFNPVHAGHWKLASVATHLLGGAVAFEMSILNVDKPALSPAVVRRRAAQFAWKGELWLTRAPTFLEKAELFPNTVFVVGADTAARIVQPRYYGDSEPRMGTALDHIRELHCRFLVAGREDASGRFVCCDDLTLSPEYRDLFAAIPPELFHVALSSTELRKREAEGTGVASSPVEA